LSCYYFSPQIVFATEEIILENISLSQSLVFESTEKNFPFFSQKNLSHSFRRKKFFLQNTSSIPSKGSSLAYSQGPKEGFFPTNGVHGKTSLIIVMRISFGY